MDFLIRCQCGEPLTVTEGSAGATIRCRCGTAIGVPALKDLRMRAGLPAYDVSPELLIEHGLASGELLADWRCLECGKVTEQAVQVMVDCEEATRKGGFSWSVFILSFLLLPIRIFHWEEEVQYGQDKSYSLPLMVCANCRIMLVSAAAIKTYMQRNPVYARLLDKFPDARVRLDVYEEFATSDKGGVQSRDLTDTGIWIRDSRR